jgi:hypothetical protein
MVIWSGRGWVPMAMLLGIGALVEWFARAQLGVAYIGWPLSVVLAGTGAASFVLGRAWNPAGQPARHTLFWIPLQAWGPLLALAAIANLVVQHT